MISTVNSLGIFGCTAYPVKIEVDVSNGLPAISIVGLPDQAVKESRDRIKPAIKNSGLPFPYRRVTVNLAPAEIKKEGPAGGSTQGTRGSADGHFCPGEPD